MASTDSQALDAGYCPTPDGNGSVSGLVYFDGPRFVRALSLEIERAGSFMLSTHEKEVAHGGRAAIQVQAPMQLFGFIEVIGSELQPSRKRRIVDVTWLVFGCRPIVPHEWFAFGWKQLIHGGIAIIISEPSHLFLIEKLLALLSQSGGQCHRSAAVGSRQSEEMTHSRIASVAVEASPFQVVAGNQTAHAVGDQRHLQLSRVIIERFVQQRGQAERSVAV